MKRDEVKEIFPEATDEAIDTILNKIGEELNPLKSQLASAEKERDQAKSALAVAKENEATTKAELDKATELLKAGLEDADRIAALEQAAAEKEAEFVQKSNSLEAKAIFVEAGCFETEEIDELVAQVVNDDVEVTKANAERIVATVNKQRKAAEEAAKDALLKSNPQISDPGKTDVTMKKSEFKALPYEQQVALRQENPNIISQLAEG